MQYTMASVRPVSHTTHDSQNTMDKRHSSNPGRMGSNLANWSELPTYEAVVFIPILIGPRGYSNRQRMRMSILRNFLHSDIWGLTP